MAFKKIIAMFIAFAVLSSCIWIPSIAENETQNQYQTEIDFLTKLGILDDSFNATATITKAELTVIIAKLLHPELDFLREGEGDAFEDVPATHQYYSYIKACKDLKIVSGDSLNQFHPDDHVTVIHAITMLINALGYTPYATANGGYPTGYYTVAMSSGISKNVSLSNSDAIIGDVVAKLVYNALFADMVNIDSVTGNATNISINKGKNILSERMGINEYDAIVIDNGVTAIMGESMGDLEKVLLLEYKTNSKITAYSLDSGVDQFVGARVKVFIKNNEETGRNEVLYFAKHRNFNEKSISSNRIINIGDSNIEYEIDENTGKTETLNFASDTPIVLYNGLSIISYDKNMFRPKDGMVQLMDFDNDNRFDVVSIYDFNYYGEKTSGAARNLVVDKVDANEGSISCKFNPSNNLDLNDEEYGYKIISSDKKTLNDLTEYDIISVAQAPKLVDDKIFYFLFVCSNSERVNIVSYTSNEVEINGKMTALSSSITSVKPSYTSYLKTDTEMTVCYDVTGKIAYIINFSTTTKNYGYLIAAAVGSGADPVLKVKILAKDGTVITTELATKVEIDKVKCTTAQKQLEALQKRPAGAEFMGKDKETKPISRPIIYKLNTDGFLTDIDTDTPNLETTSDLTTYTDQYFIKYAQEEIEDENALKAGFRNPRVSRFKKPSKYMDGKFFITSETLVLSVPDVDTYGLEKYNETNSDFTSYNTNPLNYDLIKLYERDKIDSNYKVMAFADLNYLMAYDIQGYDIDPDTGVAKLAVVRGRTDVYYYGAVPFASSTPMYVFLRKTEMYDTTLGKIITKIYYTKDGSLEYNAKVNTDDLYFAYRYLLEGCSSSESPYKVEVTPLKKGDIIRVIQAGGYLNHLERVFTLSNIQNSYSAGQYPSSSRSQYSTVAAGGIGVAYASPYDMRPYYGGLSGTYNIATVYPKSVKGNNLWAFSGSSKLSLVVVGKTTTYTDQYYSLAGVQIVLLEMDASGDVKIKAGSSSDIITYDETKDLNKSSIIMMKHVDYKIEQFFILNQTN